MQASVSLKTQPRSDVVVSLVGDSLVLSNPASLTTFTATASLTFTPSNWYRPQFLDYAFVQNFYHDHDGFLATMQLRSVSLDQNYDTSSATHASGHHSSKYLMFQKINQDTNGIVVSAPLAGTTVASTHEDGLIAVPFRLSSKPAHRVRVEVTVHDPAVLECAESGVSCHVVFERSNWQTPQHVLLRAKRNHQAQPTVTSISFRSQSADVCYDTASGTVGSGLLSHCAMGVTQQETFLNIRLQDVDAMDAMDAVDAVAGGAAAAVFSTTDATMVEDGGGWINVDLGFTTNPNIPHVVKLHGLDTSTLELRSLSNVNNGVAGNRPWYWFTRSNWWRKRRFQIRAKTNWIMNNNDELAVGTNAVANTLRVVVENITTHLRYQAAVENGGSTSVLVNDGVDSASTNAFNLYIQDDDIPALLTGFDDVARTGAVIREGSGDCAMCYQDFATGTSGMSCGGGGGGPLCALCALCALSALSALSALWLFLVWLMLLFSLLLLCTCFSCTCFFHPRHLPRLPTRRQCVCDDGHTTGCGVGKCGISAPRPHSCAFAL
jgi:hypothetical protein